MSRSSERQTFGISVDHTANEVILSELTCETDFVANNELFHEFAKSILKTVKHGKKGISQSEWDSIKPEGLKPEGLLAQSESIGEMIKTLISKTGENCKINSTQRVNYHQDEICGSYLHGNVGFPDHCTSGAYCIINVGKDIRELDKTKTEAVLNLANSLSMQIVAMTPKFLSREKIPTDVLDKEKEISRERILSKPAEERKDFDYERYLTQSESKFIEDNCLLEQEFVIANLGSIKSGTKVKQHIENVSKSLGLKLEVSSFRLFKPSIL